MRVKQMLLIALSFAGVGVAFACGARATSPAPNPDIDALRASLAPFTSLTVAKTRGYSVALSDCMSNGDAGAMGIHFGNPALIDGAVSELHPEVLIYEPGVDGDMSLVGVEFIIPFSVLPKSAPAPTLYGQRFLPDDVFGLWGLHVWTHRANPSGLFAPWNPRVHC